MSSETEEMKSAVREVLGDEANDLLVCRIDEILEQAGKTPGALPQARDRVVMMVRLFTGEDASGAVAEHFSKILDANPAS